MTVGTILVVDDEPDLRSVYELALVREGYDVDTAGSVSEGKECLANKQYDVMITDMRLPDGIGLELVKIAGSHDRPEKCLVVTAYGSAENAVEALKAGAFDYLTKPVNLKQLRQIVADVIASQERSPLSQVKSGAIAQVREANPLLSNTSEDTKEVSQKLLGSSLAMQQVRDVIARVAATMAPVLVHGESGTGKELVARAIHQKSHRAKGPFIAVNCGAIPEDLMEAEFFGYRKGAFTGANENRDGLFAAAAGGTIFLDEIGELPLLMQAKLLRVIQERAVRPLGAAEEERLDVRVVSATHRTLADDVQKGRFRQDLFYRLNVIEVIVPPLRARTEDIEEIAQSVLKRICYEASLPLIPIIEPKALAKLKAYSFPGNVRELENILQRAVAMCDGSFILENDLHMQQMVCASATTSEQTLHESEQLVTQSTPKEKADSHGISQHSITGNDLSDNHAAEALPSNLNEYLDNIEREKLVKALEQNNFNRTAAAAQLGMSLRQIRYRMERLHIDVPDSKE